MKVLYPLCLFFTFISGTFAIEPIGSFGKGTLREIFFLPDGTILRVINNHLEIADADNNVMLASFAEQSEPIWRVVVSPDGQRAVIKRYKMVELWDIAAQKELHRWVLEGLDQWEGPLPSFDDTFSPTASLLAINNGGDSIGLWNWETGDSVGQLTGERRPIRSCHHRNWSSTHCSYVGPYILSMAFSPNGRFLVVGSKRPDAEVWDVSTRRLVGHLEGHGSWVSVVAYSPDGRWIATTEPDSTKVHLWDAQRRQRVRTWQNGDIGDTDFVGVVFQLFFSPDSQRLYVVTLTPYRAYTDTDNDRVRVWDVETGQLVNEFHGEPTGLKHVSISPDKSRAILQYHYGIAVLWDIESVRRLALFADYTDRTGRLRLSPDGNSLVQVFSTVIKIWDVAEQSIRKVVFQKDQNFRRTIAISPDNQNFAVGLDSGVIDIRNLRTGELTTQIPGVYGSAAFAFNKTGKRIAAYTYSGGNVITIFDIENSQKREILGTKGESDYSTLYHIAFSDGDQYLAAAYSNHRIHLWQQEGGKYIHRYSWISSVIGNTNKTNLVFQPNSSSFPTLVVGGYKQRVETWRLEEQGPEQLLTLTAVGPAQFSRNDRYLFVNRDEQLQVWDWGANVRINHPPIPAYFAVSRDGSVLLTWNDETGHIHIWDGNALFQTRAVAVEAMGKRAITLGAIKRNALYQNYPNPFNPETWIPFQLERESDITIRI